MRKKKYGWKPDLPDTRDFLYGAVMPTKFFLPKTTDLRGTCSAVENQADLGSCTANALAGALEFLENKDKMLCMDFSRLFIYYNEREVEGNTNLDSGAFLRDGIKTLVSKGVCFEATWPYDISKFTVTPSPQCYEEALRHQVTAYYRLKTMREMKICLATGFPFVFGFSVYESFESEEVASTGIVPIPKKGEVMLGGHAVCAVGYDDDKQAFLVRNSWGPDWGIKGYFWLPYYFMEKGLANDFWVIKRGELM